MVSSFDGILIVAMAIVIVILMDAMVARSLARSYAVCCSSGPMRVA